MNNWKWVQAIAPLLVAAALLGCGGEKSNTGDSEPPVTVETVTATVQPISNVISDQGVLYPIQQASLSPKVSAPVRKFYVNRGSKVHRGQLLATLENKDLAAGVISARGSYQQAEAAYASTTTSTLPEEIQTATLNMEDAKTNMENEQKVYESESNLFKEGAIARKQLDSTRVALKAAQSAFETAREHLKNLQASGATQQQRAAKGLLESAQGQYLSAQAQLGYTNLRSPIDGVVTERAVYPGDIAPAGTPLLIVMDISRVVVRLHIAQAQAAQLKLGDAATIHVPGLKNAMPAKVSIVSPALDPNSTTVEVWVQADNPNRQLQPGTSVGVSIVAGTVPDALVIPDSAVLSGDNESTHVMVVRPDGRAYSERVTTGIQQQGLVQIVSGLRVGEEVVVGGAYGLPDKTRVKPSPASSSAGSQSQD